MRQCNDTFAKKLETNNDTIRNLETAKILVYKETC